ncbi:MAG: T9SS type A sorting domain-containing protein [Hymenobacteraceae bacterium]|nr:T9SS type A sorting domain-containing protein [Hymenobacteraceae bacterium]
MTYLYIAAQLRTRRHRLPSGRSAAGCWVAWARAGAGLLLILLARPVAAQAPVATIFTTATSPLPDNAVTALCYDARHARLWVGTDFGLTRLELANPAAPIWTIYHAATGGLPADAVRAIAVADSGGAAVWVGTFQGGLARLDVRAGTWQTWTAATSPLPFDHIRALAPEPDGGVWIGTAGGGLAHRTGAGIWQVFMPTNSALPTGNVAALVRDAVDSTVWIGTINGGLARWRRGALRNYTLLADNLPDNTVLALALDSLRRPVLGTAAAGLVRYRTDSTWAAYGPRTSANPAATVLALAADSAGRWWLGTAQHGLVGLEQGRWARFGFGSAAGLPDSTVRAVAVGAGGDLWLGLRSGGLARWRPGPLSGLAAPTTDDEPLALWPNPARVARPASVRWRAVGAATVWVYDQQGRVAWQTREAVASVRLPALAPGLYAVRVAVGARVYTRRLMVGE